MTTITLPVYISRSPANTRSCMWQYDRDFAPEMMKLGPCNEGENKEKEKKGKPDHDATPMTVNKDRDRGERKNG